MPPAVTTIVLVALPVTVNAGPLRACAQESALVDEAVRPLLEHRAAPEPDTPRLRAQLRACLNSRNICSVVYDGRDGREALVAGDVTSDLSEAYPSGQGKSFIVFLVRSIPRVRTDSNQYCLVSEKLGGATSLVQWYVYGWVIASNASESLPLQRQVLESKPASDPTLRGLAAALWFFAERMSGQPPPLEKSPDDVGR